MPEEKKENVKEVVQPQEGKAAENNQEHAQNTPQEKPKEDSQEKNWKEVRDTMKQLKEENQFLKKEVSSLKPKAPTEEDPFSALEDDDIVTVADVKKIVSKYAHSAATDLISKKEREREIENVPKNYSDYYEVIKYADEFEKENPSVAEAVLKATNPREVGYKVIKNWLLIKQKANENNENDQKLHENAKKPLSSQSVGTTSPLNDVRKYERMTSERAAEIRKLADEYASRR